ncbi:MAG: DUF2279 domain-containing protein [Bacteroidetes bacterium]|nr:DUF2279 domain-containing protein [Bacteroidota bacterium]
MQSLAQNQKKVSLFRNADSLNKNRFAAVCATQGIVWGGSLVLLNKAWYSQYPRSTFHFYNDLGEWNQVDKVGHAYSAYWGAQISSAMFRWAGVSQKRSAIYGAGMGIAYVSVIEILDGTSQKWGFSWGDMAANLSGSLLFASQEYAWKEQRIQFKFSSHPVRYDSPQLENRARNLFGTSYSEKVLKDYNGQTYWISANIHAFCKQSKFPAWLNVAIGYGAENLYGGFDNVQRDDNNQIVYQNGYPAFDRRDIRRIRQFYLAPDIDLSKIKIRGKTPALFRVLNGLKLKFPMPTIELNSEGKLKFHPVYF